MTNAELRAAVVEARALVARLGDELDQAEEAVVAAEARLDAAIETLTAAKSAERRNWTPGRKPEVDSGTR